MTDRVVKVHVSGRVQGVWFRAWTRQEADRLGLAGWVRNEADGTVSALIAGPEREVAEMLSLLWQGPPAARVDNVRVEEAEATNLPPRFSVVG